MKFLITLVALIVTNCLLAQDPYPRYAIDLNALGANEDSVAHNYKFYSCSVKRNAKYLSEWEQHTNTFRYYSGTKSNFLYIPFLPTVGSANDISILKIVKGDKAMIIYMSFSSEISYSDVIYLQNLNFSPKVYFINVVYSNFSDNSLADRENGPGDRGVIVDFSKQKKVSEKELKKLIAKHIK